MNKDGWVRYDTYMLSNTIISAVNFAEIHNLASSGGYEGTTWVAATSQPGKQHRANRRLAGCTMLEICGCGAVYDIECAIPSELATLRLSLTPHNPNPSLDTQHNFRQHAALA